MGKLPTAMSGCWMVTPIKKMTMIRVRSSRGRRGRNERGFDCLELAFFVK